MSRLRSTPPGDITLRIVALTVAVGFGVAAGALAACDGEGEQASPAADADLGRRDTGPEADGGGGRPDATHDADLTPDGGGGSQPTYRVPLHPFSPWPKFRRNAAQDGRSPVLPTPRPGAPWAFATGKGIFSSPVVGADGTVYIGSADRTFYALHPDGTERWRFETGEIIDSAALLDDRGRVYFGSGDGHLYALDAATGAEVWRFGADDPSVNSAFLRWFEGNVAMGPDGTLYAPNDNFFVYAIDRDSGEVRWRFRTPDQTWSLPAVDADSGRLFVGNNALVSLLGDNTYALDPSDGSKLWGASSNGSVAASPLLTPDGQVIVGGYDGFLRAYAAEDGAPAWEVGVRDHIYASPALLPDGTVVQPAADGTVYALDPADGSQRWAFDTGEALRSSPAVDGEGNVYLGAGDGRLYVLRPDGSLRWAIQLVAGARNDLNSSPALGEHAVYIAGESGEVFGVPYDYCLGAEGATDGRCVPGPDEALPADGELLLLVDSLGGTLVEPPATIDGNRILAFTLFVRAQGDTRLALIDSPSVQVEVQPAVDVAVTVSGGRRFLTVRPEPRWLADAGSGQLTLRVRGDYLVEPEREGLAFSGGQPGGSFERSFTFALATGEPATLPLPVPAAPGDASGVWELYRLAAPLPTILPSYNQIGFDSLHYLVGLVEGDDTHALAWVVGALPVDGPDGPSAAPDPSSGALFPFSVEVRDGLLNLTNRDGLGLEVMNARLAFDAFHLRARLQADGGAADVAALTVTTVCSDIDFYGPFLQLLGFCNPERDTLHAYGAALLRAHVGGPAAPPAGLGQVEFALEPGWAVATLTDAEAMLTDHVWSLLLVDAATGEPVSLDYGLATERSADEAGRIEAVRLKLPEQPLPALVRMYLMVDTYPAAKVELHAPPER